jgi:hypothetical protein
MVLIRFLEQLHLLAEVLAAHKELQAVHQAVLAAVRVLAELVVLVLVDKEMLVAALRVPNLLVLVAVAAQAQSVVMVPLVHQEMAVPVLHGLMGQLTLVAVAAVDGLVTGVGHLVVLAVAVAVATIVLAHQELQILAVAVAARLQPGPIRLLEEMAALEL